MLIPVLIERGESPDLPLSIYFYMGVQARICRNGVVTRQQTIHPDTLHGRDTVTQILLRS